MATRRSGRHAVVTLSAPGIADQVRAGQYAAVAVGGQNPSTLLRRAMWIAESAPTGRQGGVIEVVADAEETGGAWLAEQPRGAPVDVIAPLGRPFSAPVEPAVCLLIGIETSAAALLRLGALLTSRGSHVDYLLLGEPTRVYGALEARRLGSSLRSEAIPTGVNHRRARIADVVSAALSDADIDVVYSAGPAPDVAAVADVVAARGLPHQTALSRVTACGSGVCAACAVPVVGTDGITRVVRACTEGPVFDADRVLWQDLAPPQGAWKSPERDPHD
ncbi:MAG: hypothetical protein U0990_12165 [Candidatus Nanopelagicales bacterium]|nr:hypothetical protein [Candidatus Nanopelagicales bacterium]MDZ4250822.1 hypothetical protein [Candidatus Nanopelagicales bacterium]